MKLATIPTRSCVFMLLLLPLVSGSGCRAGTGFLPNGIMHAIDPTKFPSYTATGEVNDANAALGDSAQVTFTTAFDVWSHSAKTKVGIHDDGHVVFENAAGTLPLDGDPDTTNYIDLNMAYTQFAFAAPNWIKPDAGETGKYSIRHLVRSTALYNGPHMCDINRVESEIEQCNQAKFDTVQVDEMVLITWEIRDTAGTTILDNFQMVLAVTSTSQTYILFIYDTYTYHTTDKARGMINGYYNAAAQKEFAAICNYDTDLSAASNCKCGGKGIFVFKTTNAANTHCVQADRCAKNPPVVAGNQVEVYDSANRKSSCMDGIPAQPACDAEVYCHVHKTVTSQITITFNLMNLKFNKLTFLPYKADKSYVTFDASAVGGGCVKDVDTTQPFFRFSENIPTSVTICGMALDTTAKTIGYALYNYNGPDSYNIIREAGIVAHGVCTYSDLPLSVTVTQMQNDIAATQMPQPTRTVTFGFQDTQLMTGTSPYANQAKVNLGQDLYVYACFNRGTPWNVNVDPYGLYVHTCSMSNNAGFVLNAASPNFQFVSKVIDENGCNNDPSKVDTTSTMAFWFSQTFKRDPTVTTSPFCQVAGPVDAARWSLPVGNTEVWIRCHVDFCTNRAIETSSRCFDSCLHTNVDTIATGRKRRSTNNETESEVLEASIIIHNPGYGGDEAAGANGACINTTVATTLSATIILLLLAAGGVAAFMFFKLQKKMNKKI